MDKIDFSDAYFMRQALKEANSALMKDEIPVGVVVVSEGKIIARAHNQTETLNDVTAHAEMLSVTIAAETLGGKYLNNCTMYVTLEPCFMCAGAIAWAQLGRLVTGAPDEKRGYSNFSPSPLHPKTEVTNGVLAEECKKLIVDFFKKKR